jgi:signal transduction histidine kinase
MNFLAITRQISYLWKQAVIFGLIVLMLGSSFVYIFVHKQYVNSLEENYLNHWNAIQELRQEIFSRPEQLFLFGNGSLDFADSRFTEIIETFFRDTPGLFRLSILGVQGIFLWGKETKNVAEYFRSSSSSSPRRFAKEMQKRQFIPYFPEHIHFVQLPIIVNNHHKGFLRGEFFVSDSRTVYFQVAQLTFYVIVVAFGLMVLFGIFSIFTRITQHVSLKQKQLEEYALSLEQANVNLRRTRKELHISEKLASLGYLAAGIAHEIGNPLGAILGYVELLQRNTLDRQKTQDILMRIEREIERIRRIIQELVNFSRPQSMTIQKVDVNRVLRKIISHLPSSQEKQINIQLQLTEFPLFTQVDEYKLQTAFVNILGNSIDAIALNGDIRISTSRRIRESSTMIGGSEVIAIQFSDTGSGIPEEHLSKIFDPFFTTKDPGSGMGLGLSLCHRIIESFNGEIEVHSTPGKGTDVMVFLVPFRKKVQE